MPAGRAMRDGGGDKVITTGGSRANGRGGAGVRRGAIDVGHTRIETS